MTTDMFRSFASPAVIEFARFIFENPGATRRQIQEHLYAKINPIVDRGKWSKVSAHPDTGLPGWLYQADLREMTREEYMKNANTHLFSPYYTVHLSNVEGSERNYRGVVMDWFRTRKDTTDNEGRKGQFQYWLTSRGLRLLDAKPFPATDNRCHQYRDPEDYDRRYMKSVILVDGPPPASSEVMDAVREMWSASGPEPVVELYSTEEEQMNSKCEPGDLAGIPFKISLHDELTDITMSTWSQIPQMIIKALEEDPGTIIDNIGENQLAVLDIFGKDLGRRLVNTYKVMRLTSDAALIAEELD